MNTGQDDKRCIALFHSDKRMVQMNQSNSRFCKNGLLRRPQEHVDARILTPRITSKLLKSLKKKILPKLIILLVKLRPWENCFFYFISNSSSRLAESV